MSYWVTIRKILDLCQGAKDLAGGGRLKQTCWDQVIPLEWEDYNWQGVRTVQVKGGEIRKDNRKYSNNKG